MSLKSRFCAVRRLMRGSRSKERMGAADANGTAAPAANADEIAIDDDDDDEDGEGAE